MSIDAAPFPIIIEWFAFKHILPVVIARWLRSWDNIGFFFDTILNLTVVVVHRDHVLAAVECRPLHLPLSWESGLVEARRGLAARKSIFCILLRLSCWFKICLPLPSTLHPEEIFSWSSPFGSLRPSSFVEFCMRVHSIQINRAGNYCRRYDRNVTYLLLVTCSDETNNIGCHMLINL